VAAVRGMPVDAVEELRWRRDVVGCVGPGMEYEGSGCVEVEDVVLATDAECALRAESSRVKRFTWALLAYGGQADRPSSHTTASCSFSSSKCNSAAVIGRGCLIGKPGPPPSLLATVGLSGGNGKFWTPGGIAPLGDARGRGGGFMGNICDARRDVGSEGCRELDGG
jgi:hypothetical protein